jgi:type VI protein secretion system component VasK
MFLAASGDAFAPRTLMNAQVAFSREFLDFIGKMHAVRQALFPPGSPDVAVNFDMTADATAGVTQSLLELDGKRMLYRNEAPSPFPFAWPSKSGTSQARLTVSLEGSGEHPSTAPAEGEWALFRLLGQARISRESQTTYQVVWSLPGADGRRREVKYRLQARTIRNPFAPDFFRGIACPERATQPAAYSGANGIAR